MSGFGMRNAAINHAMRSQEVFSYGVQLGLTRDQCVEVIDTWIEWYRGRLVPFSWDPIQSAMVHRGLGEEWRPGAIGRRYLMPDPEGRSYEDDPRTNLLEVLQVEAERVCAPIVDMLNRVAARAPWARR